MIAILYSVRNRDNRDRTDGLALRRRSLYPTELYPQKTKVKLNLTLRLIYLTYLFFV